MIIDEEYVIGVFRDLFERCYRLEMKTFFERCYRIEMEPREVEYPTEKAYKTAYEAWYNSVYLPSVG